MTGSASLIVTTSLSQVRSLLQQEPRVTVISDDQAAASFCREMVDEFYTLDLGDVKAVTDLIRVLVVTGRRYDSVFLPSTFSEAEAGTIFGIALRSLPIETDVGELQ